MSQGRICWERFSPCPLWSELGNASVESANNDFCDFFTWVEKSFLFVGFNERGSNYEKNFKSWFHSQKYVSACNVYGYYTDFELCEWNYSFFTTGRNNLCWCHCHHSRNSAGSFRLVPKLPDTSIIISYVGGGLTVTKIKNHLHESQILGHI